MNYLDNLRIRARLSVGFAVVLVLAASMAGWGILKLSQLNEATQTIVGMNWEKAVTARTKRRGSFTRDSVFRDGVARQMATMGGDAASGFMAKLTVAV